MTRVDLDDARAMAEDLDGDTALYGYPAAEIAATISALITLRAAVQRQAADRDTEVRMLREQAADLDMAVDERDSENADLRAEVKRLRAAAHPILTQLVTGMDPHDITQDSSWAQAVLVRARDVHALREALGEDATDA